MAKKPMPPFMKAAAPKSAAAMGKQPAAKKAPGVKAAFEKSGFDKDKGLKEGSPKDKKADARQLRNMRLSKAKL